MQFENLVISAIPNPAISVLIAKQKHYYVTEQNIVALKAVSLISPAVSQCPFYRTTALTLLQMKKTPSQNFYKGFLPQLVTATLKLFSYWLFLKIA